MGAMATISCQVKTQDSGGADGIANGLAADDLADVIADGVKFELRCASGCLQSQVPLGLLRPSTGEQQLTSCIGDNVLRLTGGGGGGRGAYFYADGDVPTARIWMT